MRKNSNVFMCKTCAESPEFEKEAFFEHLKTVHNVGGHEKMTRSMLCHMDARNFYESTYLWEHEKVSFVQKITTRRDKDDMMRIS